MSAFHTTDTVTIHHGDCLDVLRELPDASVDAVVTDPPYGLSNTDPEHVVETLVRWINGDREYIPEGTGFMGKAWDAFVPPVAVWDQCLRVLKPGGHVLAYAGSRTHDLMTLGIRLAGFEIRDSIAWLYGTGFPKSLDVSKAIDKAAGAVRVASGDRGAAECSYLDRGEDCPGHGDAGQSMSGATVHRLPTSPATPDAERWQGWGTALKPAFEPIVVGRKPLAGTVAANVLVHGTGALNVDGCRVATSDDLNGGAYAKIGGRSESASLHAGSGMNVAGKTVGRDFEQPPGRWPANVVLDDSQAAELDRACDHCGAALVAEDCPNYGSGPEHAPTAAVTSGPSRFFPTFKYQAKAPTRERPKVDGTSHATVKPLELMRWLVRLVTPPGGVVLEPFAGSGTTVEACLLEGFRCIAIEREAEYLPLILHRIERVS